MQNIAVFVATGLLACTGSVDVQNTMDLLNAGGDDMTVVNGDLAQLKMYLRADDFRLVRPGPHSLTSQRQAELAQKGVIELVAVALRSLQLQTRVVAAELVHLLTTNNPANRAALGAAGVIPPLIDMVAASADAKASDDEVLGGEEAAEAIWILAFSGGGGNSGANHVEFTKHNAVKALADQVLRSPSSRSRMWAGAALGNLAAAYESVPRETSEAVRAQMLSTEGLLPALVRMIKLGPVQEDTPADLWPSQATTAQRFSSSIEAWGAGQALKNLALSHAAHATLRQLGAVKALCYLRSSPDWLERMKADMTLTNMRANCLAEQDL